MKNNGKNNMKNSMKIDYNFMNASITFDPYENMDLSLHDLYVMESEARFNQLVAHLKN